MKLEGSCHCGAVRFAVETRTACPFMRCYCSVCRKTGGGGGYVINLGAEMASLTVEGDADIAVYQATIDGAVSPAQRHFCRRCGSALWLFDPRWPDLVHPFASAIDSRLPKPPAHAHIMLAHKAPWVEVGGDARDGHFDEYPEQSIEDWHRGHGLFEDAAS